MDAGTALHPPGGFGRPQEAPEPLGAPMVLGGPVPFGSPKSLPGPSKILPNGPYFRIESFPGHPGLMGDCHGRLDCP